MAKPKSIQDTAAALTEKSKKAPAKPINRPRPVEVIVPQVFISDKANRTYPTFISFPETTYPNQCANCGGSGFMSAFYATTNGSRFPNPSTRVPSTCVDGTWYEGALKTEPCPVCAGDFKARFLAKNCGLTGKELDIRVNHYQAAKGKERAKAVALELMQHSPRPVGFVTFYGSYGVGKTFLLKALINQFRLAGILSVYARMSDILATVRSSFGDQTKDAAEALIYKFRNYRVLAIDEVDKVNLTKWSAEVIFRLIDVRYEASERILTLIATNSDPHINSEEFGYLSSRMTGGTVIAVTGEDMRQTYNN